MKKLEKENRLTDTAIDLLHLIKKFGKLHKLKNEITLHFVNNQQQLTANRQENKRRIE